MLETVEWGEFELNSLFRSENGDFDIKKEHINNMGNYVITAGLSNNGILGRTNVKAKIFPENTITVDMFGTAFYRDFQYKMVTHARVFCLIPLIEISKIQGIFLSSSLRFLPQFFGYENMCSWQKIKNLKIQLPIKNCQINFDFMEKFVAELEAQRTAELEAYLSAAGLKDYTLTTEEERALAALENREITFIEYKVVDLFTVKNTNNILSRDVTPNSGNTPYLSASRENNAVSFYISHRENLIDKGNCIFIGGKTFVVTYQAEDFYSNDSHNLCLYLKEKKEASKLNQLCIISCIERNLGHKYSWGDSISNKKIQTDTVFLPSKNGKPDYAYMQTLISAVQKQVIKDVVRYADEKIAATKTVTAR